MSNEWKTFAHKLYYTPKSEASFQSSIKLYPIIKKKFPFVSLKEVKLWLQNQESFSLNKAVRRTFKRGRVIVAGIDDQYDTDLMSMLQYKSSNNNVSFVLVIIDILSRFVWIKQLKTKHSKQVVDAFKSLFKATERIPKRIRSDRGKEFTSVETQKYFKSIGVHQMFTGNEQQANYVERVIKTLKSKIRRYMTINRTTKYVDILENIVYSYNHTVHSSINMKPAQITKKYEKEIWWNSYLPTELKLNTKHKKKHSYKYNIDDNVRISHLRHAFQREYDIKWSGEIFVISSRFIRQDQPIYKIKDIKGEEITGSFYEYELQKVSIPSDKLYEIEKEIKRRVHKGKKQVLVKFKHWPNKFNEWINVDDLINT